MRPVQPKHGLFSQYGTCPLSNLKTVNLLNMHPAQPKYGLSTLLLIKKSITGTRTNLFILNDEAENLLKLIQF